MARQKTIRCQQCRKKAPNSTRGRPRSYCSPECAALHAAVQRLHTTLDAWVAAGHQQGLDPMAASWLRTELVRAANKAPLPRDKKGRFKATN
jgi:hypothetical protein